MEDRIGVSALFMPAGTVSPWEALDLACEAGFAGVEIIPADFHGILGHPRTMMSLGFNLDRIEPAELDRLAESVSRFRYRHVHSLCRGVNIASRNPGIAGESVRQFRQCADLAVRIGAQLLTFHPGIQEPEDEIGYDDFIVAKNIEFGREMADFVEKHDLRAGFENLGGSPLPAQMQAILDGVGSGRFGLQFDIGHSFLLPPRDPFVWLDLLGERIVGPHLHGTFHRSDRGLENHQSLSLLSCKAARASRRLRRAGTAWQRSSLM